MKRVFISYAHNDAAFRDALVVHLQVLCTAGIIENWHDGELQPGADWKATISRELQAADIIVLLVSAHFLASKSCQELELGPALTRWMAESALIMPVIVRSCDWEVSPLARLQVLPSQGKPIATWTHEDDAWTEVTRKIRGAAMQASGASRVSPKSVLFKSENNGTGSHYHSTEVREHIDVAPNPAFVRSPAALAASLTNSPAAYQSSGLPEDDPAQHLPWNPAFARSPAALAGSPTHSPAFAPQQNGSVGEDSANAGGYGGDFKRHPPPPGQAQRAVLTGGAGIFCVDARMESLRVGRNGAVCAILLAEPRVSSVHASVKIEGGQLLVRDENSNNGTFVSGQRIPSMVWISVSHADSLRFGPVEFFVRLE